jgi:hypothetical protein
MMPQQQPEPSTTGTRRIWFSSITASTSSSLVSSLTTTTGSVMHSAAVTADGFLPLATTRQTMSRSVMTPINRLDESVTGISPQSASTMRLATSLSVVSPAQHCGAGVMISFASFDIPASMQVFDHIERYFSLDMERGSPIQYADE